MRTAGTLLLLSALLPGAVSGAAPAVPAGTPRFVAEVPFTSCGDGLVCLPVTLDGGRRQTFILDTGDVQSFVAQDAAQANGWKLLPVADRSGKVVPGYSKTQARVHLGGVALELKMLVLARQDMAPGKVPYDGGLAFTDLPDRVVQLDFPRHVLRISDVVSGGAAVKRPGTLKRITFGQNGPPILTGGPFTVNGKTLQAQIDTGYTGTMVVYDQSIAGLGLAAAAKAGAGHGRSFPYTDGGVTMLGAPVASVGFASRVLADHAPTIYFPTPGVHQPDGLFEATVGTELFRSSVLTLDLHAMTFDVEPAGRT